MIVKDTEKRKLKRSNRGPSNEHQSEGETDRVSGSFLSCDSDRVSLKWSFSWRACSNWWSSVKYELSTRWKRSSPDTEATAVIVVVHELYQCLIQLQLLWLTFSLAYSELFSQCFMFYFVTRFIYAMAFSFCSKGRMSWFHIDLDVLESSVSVYLFVSCPVLCL